jgi:phosphoglycerate dehydrogenase-like enzyme
MTRILLFEPAYQRIKWSLPVTEADELLLMDADGTIRSFGKPIAVDDAAPEVGWPSVDLFRTKAGRDYFIALLKSPSLKWVQSSAAGFENPVFAQLVQKGARLTTNHSQAVGMSEYVLWGVLDHLQRGPDRRTEQAAHRWQAHPFIEVSGSRWLVIGFGAIGQAVARRAQAFDAHVTGVRRSPGAHEHADAMATPDQIPDLLPTSDVVVLSTPLNAQSANMVDAAFLSRMKPGSVLVNVGRGGLVDEEALRAALEAGTPAHTVLDVFQTEPLPEDSWFWHHPRVTLTPHASPIGSGLAARSDALFVENLGRYLAGKPLLNEVSAAEVTGG